MKIHGFTLVELVLCIILIGIASSSALGFIAVGGNMTASATSRASAARFLQDTMLRIEREAANSIPYQISWVNSSSEKTLGLVVPEAVFRVYQNDNGYIYISLLGDNDEISDILINGGADYYLAFVGSDGSLIRVAINSGGLKISGYLYKVNLGSSYASLFSGTTRAYLIGPKSYVRYVLSGSVLNYEKGSFSGGVFTPDSSSGADYSYSLNYSSRLKIMGLYVSLDDGMSISNMNSASICIMTELDEENVSACHIVGAGNVQ